MRLLLVGLIPLMALGGEKQVPAENVPKGVVEAASARFPKAKLVRFSEEREGAALNYEVSLEVEGKKVELLISPEGRVLVEERVIARAELPDAVSKGLAGSRYAKWVVRRIERVEETKRPGAPDFELVVELEGKRRELLFDGVGTLKKDEAD